MVNIAILRFFGVFGAFISNILNNKFNFDTSWIKFNDNKDFMKMFSDSGNSSHESEDFESDSEVILVLKYCIFPVMYFLYS